MLLSLRYALFVTTGFSAPFSRARARAIPIAGTCTAVGVAVTVADDYQDLPYVDPRYLESEISRGNMQPQSRRSKTRRISE